MKTTFKAYKLEYRRLGSGWHTIDNLAANKLDEFVSFHNIQEYIIHEIKIVNLELKTIDILFKGVKYIALTERTLGSSEYDRDDTPVKEVSEVNEVDTAIQQDTNKDELNTNKESKLKRTSYFIRLFNGEHEKFNNGYEFTLPTGHTVIVHKDKQSNSWNTTIKDVGIQFTHGSKTRKEAIEQANELSNRLGKDSINEKLYSYI